VQPWSWDALAIPILVVLISLLMYFPCFWKHLPEPRVKNFVTVVITAVIEIVLILLTELNLRLPPSLFMVVQQFLDGFPGQIMMELLTNCFIALLTPLYTWLHQLYDKLCELLCRLRDLLCGLLCWLLRRLYELLCGQLYWLLLLLYELLYSLRQVRLRRRRRLR
jgi:hypothetical protein